MSTVAKNPSTPVKARRFYRDAIAGDVVRVTGWENVTVGIGDTERVERWCRVRLEGQRRSSILIHPGRLIPVKLSGPEVEEFEPEFLA